MKEFAGGHCGRFRPKESLKSPAQVRAIPGIQPVAFGGNPVIPQHRQHSRGRAPLFSSYRFILSPSRLNLLRLIYGSNPHRSAQRRGQVLVNEKPVCAALLPYSRVADVGVRGLPVLRFLREMHRNGGPRNCSVPRNVQILARGQGSTRHVREDRFLHPVVVFLPSVISEWRYIVENQAVVLRIKLRWGVRVASAPCGAVGIDTGAERSLICSPLLRPRTHEGQQGSRKRHRHIQEPPPAFSSYTATCGRLRSHWEILR